MGISAECRHATASHPRLPPGPRLPQSGRAARAGRCRCQRRSATRCERGPHAACSNRLFQVLTCSWASPAAGRPASAAACHAISRQRPLAAGLDAPPSLPPCSARIGGAATRPAPARSSSTCMAATKSILAVPSAWMTRCVLRGAAWLFRAGRRQWQAAVGGHLAPRTSPRSAPPDTLLRHTHPLVALCRWRPP